MKDVKFIILMAFAICVIGLLGELFKRMVDEDGKGKLKLLLMLVIYWIYGAIMIAVYIYVPIFKIYAFMPIYAVIGGIVATGVELGFGLLYNRVLKLNVWAYPKEYLTIINKKIPISFMGQIKLKHSIMYAGLTLIVPIVEQAVRWLII
jgi:hypothetical protein